jgi:hypothetical protein
VLVRRVGGANLVHVHQTALTPPLTLEPIVTDSVEKLVPQILQGNFALGNGALDVEIVSLLEVVGTEQL